MNRMLLCRRREVRHTCLSRLLVAVAICAWSNSPCMAEVPDSYRKLWSAPEVVKRIDEGIRQHRQGDALVKVVDANGKPVTAAALDIRQKTHEFLFGCNVLVLGQLGNKNERYEGEFAKLFNLATTTFCWSAIEPTPNRLRFAEGSEEIWRRPPPDRVVTFGKKYGIALKGQPLLADSWLPKWVPDDPNEVRKLYQNYFKQVADRYSRDIRIWDIVNESQLCAKRSPNFPLYNVKLDYVGWAFAQTRPLFPPETLLEINEATPVNGPWRDRYFEQVKDLVDRKTGVNCIGFQFHLFTNSSLKAHLAGRAYPPSQLIETYDKFAQLGLPLFISEITIPTTLEPAGAGEAIQAEVLTNLYRLWFGMSNMAGIVYWNLPDGAAWKNEGLAKAGLLDEDLREKPAYQALSRLINHDWKTRANVKTDSQGKARFRGFYGKYRVVVAVGGRSQQFDIDLSKNGLDSFTLEWQS